MTLNLKILKFFTYYIFRIFIEFNEGTVRVIIMLPHSASGSYSNPAGRQAGIHSNKNWYSYHVMNGKCNITPYSSLAVTHNVLQYEGHAHQLY